jgi:hypothetical protein
VRIRIHATGYYNGFKCREQEERTRTILSTSSEDQSVLQLMEAVRQAQQAELLLKDKVRNFLDSSPFYKGYETDSAIRSSLIRSSTSLLRIEDRRSKLNYY